MRFFIGLMLVCVLSACAAIPPQPKAPERRKDYATFPLNHCKPEMEQAAYWIAKLPNPDKVLLTPKHISRLNKKACNAGLLTHVFSEHLWDYKYTEVDRTEEINPDATWNSPAASCVGLVGGYTLYTYLKEETERIKARVRYDDQGQPIAAAVFAGLDENLNLHGIHEDNPIRYGFTVRRSDFRFFPTDMLMSSDPEDVDFDVVQVSAIRALQALAILHESRDGKWLFAVSAICRGWIKRQDVAENCQYQDIKPFLEPEKRLVVIGHMVTVASTPGDTRVAEKLYLGTSCPIIERQESYYMVSLPARDAQTGSLTSWVGYIASQADVHEGFLEYTPRNLYQMAFQLLHTPYSWGGKGEFRDCSQFIMDMYASMGINMPRNSAAQASMGSGRKSINRGGGEKRRHILARVQGPALLQFPGHIMLYLGQEDEYVYAIHDIWSYRIPDPDADHVRKVIIGQVAVSDLSLGEGSRRGSLLERITSVNALKP